MQTVAVTSVQLDCFLNTKLTGSDLTWGHLLQRHAHTRTHIQYMGVTRQRGLTHTHTYTAHTRWHVHLYPFLPLSHTCAAREALTTWEAMECKSECIWGGRGGVMGAGGGVKLFTLDTLNVIQNVHAFFPEWMGAGVLNPCGTRRHAIILSTADRYNQRVSRMSKKRDYQQHICHIFVLNCALDWAKIGSNWIKKKREKKKINTHRVRSQLNEGELKVREINEAKGLVEERKRNQIRGRWGEGERLALVRRQQQRQRNSTPTNMSNSSSCSLSFSGCKEVSALSTRDTIKKI